MLLKKTFRYPFFFCSELISVWFLSLIGHRWCVFGIYFPRRWHLLMLITLWQNGPIKYHRWLDSNLTQSQGKLRTASEGSVSLNEATRCLQNDWWLIKRRGADRNWRMTPQLQRWAGVPRNISKEMMTFRYWPNTGKTDGSGRTNCRHFTANDSRVAADCASFYTHPPDSITPLHLICDSIREEQDLIMAGDADGSYHPNRTF